MKGLNKRNLIYKSLNAFTAPFKSYNAGRLRVLAYHTVVNTEIFESQLQFLRKNYNIIDLAYLESHLFNGKELPENAILLTFDDGDYSVLEFGMPLLKKYGIPSVLFIITDLIETNKSFWWNRAYTFYKNSRFSDEQIGKKISELKDLPNNMRIEELDKMPEVFTRQLTVRDLKELESSGMVICNHTHTHPILNKCSKGDVKLEVSRAMDMLESWGFQHNQIFAYPNGNFNSRAEKILKHKGISTAFLFDHKINVENINPMRISRIRVDSDTEIDEFQVKVSGLHPFLFNKFLK
ncbi:peptidoglycan/xylan/chitin deacetylase (PgdA/CDA1 family) [Christiangramia gaetbulicola]|uniref:Peptidoglycan/xylan/chitin deacetylase (PgdA/CDA1 family) n=1 Tax=Christiangramia gaetbulicola TaxID=703340 RepID=A0A2T6AFM0_9FLAO|nr:polysaccharide deacetylase family protein [Christiangramia gaetbulicola]PTX42620.1 peptidoglycan/xylan/chitin deacetylase (PgdA/CDA1 family) [Christiangramia gaetbulicola]